MSYQRLYRILVPDAPLHRRTDHDRFTSEAAAERVHFSNLMERLTVQPGLQTPSLVSSYKGSIDQLLLAFPNWGVNNQQLAAGYRSVLESLRSGTEFVIVHHKGFKAPIEQWLADAGHSADSVTWVPLPRYTSFTDWAEDGYVALEDSADGSQYLMEPWEFPRQGDALIADSAEEFAGLRASQSPLIFQGGNCLIGDDFWLLGKDYFADSLKLVSSNNSPVEAPEGMSHDEFVRQLFSEFLDSSRDLRLLGTTRPIPIRPLYGTREPDGFYLDLPADGVGTFQPIFHIDMLVTLVGRNESGEFQDLVGSPDLADELLGTTSPFGLGEIYNQISDQLADWGLVVKRNPLVHRPTIGRTFTLRQLRDFANEPPGDPDLLEAVRELEASGATDDTGIQVRSWHHITWNNCLVENSETHGEHVYLPTFGGREADLQPIDQYMSDMWQSLGFTPHMLADFNAFARRQGVVHCIKKYLKRGS